MKWHLRIRAIPFLFVPFALFGLQGCRLHHPARQAAQPGTRGMSVPATEGEISRKIIAALSYRGPEPDRVSRRVFEHHCTNCHLTQHLQGGAGNDLTHIGAERSLDWIMVQIRHPERHRSRRVGGSMPTFPRRVISERQLDHLARYLSGQKQPVLLPNTTYGMLHESDILDPPGLIRELKSGSLPLSRYLRDVFPPKTRRQLKSYDPRRSSPSELAATLRFELNRLIVNRVSLYDTHRFRGIRLSADSRTLLAFFSTLKQPVILMRHPQQDASIFLNRLLLTDAYPLLLKRPQVPSPTRRKSALSPLAIVR